MPVAPYPVIRVRSLIDERCRGVREPLEDKATQLAKDVAKLISSRPTCPDGSLMRCVVSETVIGGVVETNRCKEQFRTENVCVDLIVTVSWNCITKVPNLDPSISHATWGFNGTKRPGAMTLAATAAAYNVLDIPCSGICGHDVQDVDDSGLTDDVIENILRYVCAALGVGLMKGRNHLSIRTVSMGVAGCRVSGQFFVDYLSMRAEYIDMAEIDRRIAHGIYNHQEYETALTWAREHLTIGENRNPRANRFTQEEYDEQFNYCIKMLLIDRDLVGGNPALAELGLVEGTEDHDAIAMGLQGQRQWMGYKPNGDILEAFPNTTLDWNGKRPEKVFATEGDAGSTVAILFNPVLAHRPQFFNGMRTYWSSEAAEWVTGHKLEGRAESGLISLCNSGTTIPNAAGEEKDAEGNPIIKHQWEITEVDIEMDLKAPTFRAATRECFPGGGFSTRFTVAGGMSVAATRLNFVAGQGPALQIFEGWTVKLPDDVYDQVVNRTDPIWPTTFFVPRLVGQGTFTSIYNWIASWGINHTTTGYGRSGADPVTLALMLRVPVYMHSIERERILRLKAQVSFGIIKPESIDFRACAISGPLYR